MMSLLCAAESTAAIVTQGSSSVQQHTAPFTCQWSGFIDRGTGIDHYDVCFTTSTSSCNLPSALLTVPNSRSSAVYDWVNDDTLSADDKASITATLAAAPTVYCIVTAFDSVDLSASSVGPGVALSDAAVTPSTVTLFSGKYQPSPL